MKQNYVPTTLGQFLNENRSITLTRKYGQKEPVVIGSRAPLRNQILSFVDENVKVNKADLKKFISDLNENNASPAAINMWLKRNEKYFVTETKGVNTTYKLSSLGQKLVKMLVPVSETISESETEIDEKCNCPKGTPVRPKRGKVEEWGGPKYGRGSGKPAWVEKEEEEEGWGSAERSERSFREREMNAGVEDEEDYDFKDRGKKGIYDKACTESASEKCEKCGKEECECNECNESEAREARIQKIIENIKAKKAASLLEEEKKEVDPADELEVEDVEEKPEEKEETEEKPEETEEASDESDDDKVEISDFVIDVDDAEEAIAELAELGIPAEKVLDGGEELPAEGGEELAPEEELPAEGGEELAPEGGEESPIGDFDLDLSGEIEGEEKPEVEESVTGMEKEEKRQDPNLTEADDELDLPVEGEEDELDLPIEGGDDEIALPGEGEELAPEEELPEAPETTGTQIKVSAEHWSKLKGWLESKGVNIEDTFGEIEVEGEEGEGTPEEDEISFDGLEDEVENEEEPKGEEGEEKEDEKESEGEEKEEKKDGFEPGKKGVNPFPKK